MKIRRIEIRLEPAPDETNQILVQVWTDGGRHFTEMIRFSESHFEDTFSFIMKDVERRIRNAVAKQIT